MWFVPTCWSDQCSHDSTYYKVASVVTKCSLRHSYLRWWSSGYFTVAVVVPLFIPFSQESTLGYVDLLCDLLEFYPIKLKFCHGLTFAVCSIRM